MKMLMPVPIFVPEYFFIITGAGIWKKQALIPIVRISPDKIRYEGATVIKDMLTAVTSIESDRIITVGFPDAYLPITGLNNEGKR